MYLIKKPANELESRVAKTQNKLKLIDTPVYRYWEAFYMSFYSGRLYADVGSRWKGLGLIYLLLSFALLSIPFAVKMAIAFNHSYNEQIIEPLLQVPTIYVQNGEVSFDKPMPYFIKDKKGKVVLIIDTTGTVNDFSSQYPELSILITKNQISVKIPNPKIFDSVREQASFDPPISQTFDKVSNFVIDGKKIVEENSISGFKYASMAMIFPTVVAVFYSIFAVLFLVFAFLGQIFSAIFFSFKISFMQSSRLFMVASTPMSALLILFLTFNAIFPGFGFILIAFMTLYYSFAVYSFRAVNKLLVTQ